MKTRKHLLVEGEDDKYSIVQLMAAHVPWGDSKPNWPVIIQSCNGFEEILDPVFIPTFLSSREVEILGVVIDANDSAEARWTSIKAIAEIAGAKTLPDSISQ